MAGGGGGGRGGGGGGEGGCAGRGGVVTGEVKISRQKRVLSKRLGSTKEIKEKEVIDGGDDAGRLVEVSIGCR